MVVGRKTVGLGLLLLCVVSCEKTSEFETLLKRDDSKPGYVGVLRALEISKSAHHFANDLAFRCEPPWPPSFEGTFTSRIRIGLKQHGKEKRSITNEITYVRAGSNRSLTLQSKTKDGLDLVHDRERIWRFIDGKSSLEETVGFGKIVGAREVQEFETRRMDDAAISGWRLVRAFDTIEKKPCRVPESEWLGLVGDIRGVSDVLDQETENAVKISKDVSLEGSRSLRIRYTHELTPEVPELKHPELSEVEVRNFREENNLLKTLREAGVLDEVK